MTWMMTVFSTPFAFMRSSSISAVASFSGGLVVSLAQGYFGSFFHTCTWGSMMRYFCAARAAAAASAPRAVLRLTVWLIWRVYSYGGRAFIHYRFVGSGRWMTMLLREAKILSVSNEIDPRIRALLGRMESISVETVSSGL